MNAIEQYIKGEGKDEGNLKPKTVMECYLSGVKRPSFPKYSKVIEAYLGNKYAFDAWKEEDHPRDKDGKFGKGENDKNKNYVERKPQYPTKTEILKGVKIENSEKGIIRDNLNRRLAGKKSIKGKIIRCRTANYLYVIKVLDYDKYIPIRRKEII